jgi:hypothetical protein
MRWRSIIALNEKNIHSFYKEKKFGRIDSKELFLKRFFLRAKQDLFKEQLDMPCEETFVCKEMSEEEVLITLLTYVW